MSTLLQFPGNLPEVTAMGGTQFNEGAAQYWGAKNASSGASALGYIPETVWNENDLADGLGAGGGGASATISKPDWQVGPGVPADGARDTPDLSLSSAGHDGYLITYQGNTPLRRRRNFRRGSVHGGNSSLAESICGEAGNPERRLVLATSIRSSYRMAQTAKARRIS